MSSPALKKRKINDNSSSQSQERATSSTSPTMAAPESDSGYGTQSPPASDSIEVKLTDLTPEERQERYKNFFSNQVDPLTHIDVLQSSESPELTQEVTEAYHRYTTFSAKIWANYDAAAKKFFVDQRAQDCGNINMIPTQRARLDAIAQKTNFQLKRMRLEIGTPFKTGICVIKLIAQSSKIDDGMAVKARVVEADSEHPLLVNWLRHQCDQLSTSVLTDQRGFTLADIDEIATWFRREPTQKEIDNMTSYWNRDRTAWMDFHDKDQENEGWTDIQRYGKGCPLGCEGCDEDRYGRYSSNKKSSYWWYSVS